MALPETLLYAANLAAFLKYPLIFLGTAVNGPMLILASGYLVHLGVLDALPAFFALALGELTQDVLIYTLGYRYAEGAVVRFGRYVGVTMELFAKIKHFFSEHGVIVLFVAKLTMGGFGTMAMILLTAGATRMPFRKFITVAILGEAAWVSAVLALGYWFGRFSEDIARDFRIAFLAGAFALAALLIYGTGRYVRSRVMNEPGNDVQP